MSLRSARGTIKVARRSFFSQDFSYKEQVGADADVASLAFEPRGSHMSWGKEPKALTKKLRNEALVVTSTSYDVTFRPQALLWGRHGITKCVPLSRGRDHLSMWSAGCLVEKPFPLESQKPTSRPWPMRLLGLGIVFLRVAARLRFVRRYQCSTRARCITLMRIRLRPRRNAALPR